MLEPIYLPDLIYAPEQTERVVLDQFLDDLDTLTPVQGQLQAVHNGNYLQVDCEAATIVTLTCDRCLQQYNTRLSVQASELIWLKERSSDAACIDPALVEQDPELIETLPPNGYFQTEDWVYQQLCLALPAQQLCDETCPGIDHQEPQAPPQSDQRWAALADFKQRLM